MQALRRPILEPETDLPLINVVTRETADQKKQEDTALDLHESERADVMNWVQNAMVREDVFCVPMRKLLKILRVSQIEKVSREVCAFLKGVDDPEDADAFDAGNHPDFMVRPPKTGSMRTKADRSVCARTYLTLEGAIVTCHWIYVNKKYGTPVWTRARKVETVITDYEFNTTCVLGAVRDAKILMALDSDTGTSVEFRIADATNTAIMLKAKTGANGVVHGRDIVEVLKAYDAERAEAMRARNMAWDPREALLKLVDARVSAIGH